MVSESSTCDLDVAKFKEIAKLQLSQRMSLLRGISEAIKSLTGTLDEEEDMVDRPMHYTTSGLSLPS